MGLVLVKEMGEAKDVALDKVSDVALDKVTVLGAELGRDHV